MNGKMRKPIAWLLTLAMLATLLPGMSFAAMATEVDNVSELSQTQDGQSDIQEEAAASDETEEFAVETVTCTAVPEVDLPGDEELFAAFVERELYGYESSFFGNAARDNLNTAEQGIYDALKEQIETVAAQGGSAKFALSEVNGLQTKWTNEELGVTGAFTTQESFNAAAAVAQTKLEEQYDFRKVLTALLSDCPLDLYWFDKTEGAGQGLGASAVDNATAIQLKLTFTFTVVTAYQGENTAEVTTEVSRIGTAKANAQQVVDANESKSDYEKLVAYKEYICDAVSYNDEAASDDYTGGYGDPWQLIYVFDGDAGTEVVCEGYSKAFQYLCDLSGLSCISVSGVMYVFYANGDTSGGAHMWNIVTLESGNYLVDVTNSDGDSETGVVSVGYDGSLFLVGGTAADNGQYNFDTIGDTVTAYLYDNETTQLWSKAELTLAQTNYTPPQDGGSTDSVSGYCGGEEDGTNLTWELTDGVLTISGSGAMANYSSETDVPWYAYRSSVTEVVVENNVTTIGDNAFSGFSALEQVDLPTGLTTIGSYAFFECGVLSQVDLPSGLCSIGFAAFAYNEKLECITIPNTLTTIGENAFEACNELESVNIPDSVTEIGEYAFQNCLSLEQVTLGSGITSIGDYVFAYCSSLKNITIPAGVTSIGMGAFCYCSGLQQVTFTGDAPTIDGNAFTYSNSALVACYPANNATWTAEKRQNYGGTITWESYVPVLASGICGGEGDGTNLTWELTGDGVLTISGSGAMADYLHDDVSAAPWDTYKDSVTKVVVGDNVTTIGDFAFENHEGLTTVELPDTLTEIGLNAFDECTALSEITLPDALTTIGDEAFYGCSSLETLAIPEEVNDIGRSAFMQCVSLREMELPPNLTYVNYGLFWMCSALESVTIPDGVESIFSSAFEDCDALKTVDIPDSVTFIDDYAFGFSGLESISIPASVTTIDRYAFIDCTSLTQIRFEGDAPAIDAQAFTGVTATAYYPLRCTTWTSDKLTNYDGTLTWESYVNILGSGYCGGEGDGTNLKWTLTDDGTLTISGSGKMADYSSGSQVPWYASRSSITKVVVEDNVTTVGAYAFYSMSAMKQVELPTSLTTIGSYAFTACSGLTQLELPVGLNTIGLAAFSSCDMLESVTIPNTVTTIDSHAFNLCTALISVAIPDSVTELGADVFAHCTALREVTLGGGIAYISMYTFDGCTALERIVIPGNVTNITGQAFSGCTALGEIAFEGDAPTIADDAFTDVTATAYYPVGNTSWTTSVMQDYGGDLTWESYVPVLASGYCGGEGDGTNLKWVLTVDGVLTISGSGTMKFFGEEAAVPWHAYRGVITGVKATDGVTSIGNHAFTACTKLENVELSDTVTSIGYNAFSNCTALTQVELPAALTTLGDKAFYYCSKLTQVELPSGLSTIGNDAFTCCTSLESITIPDTVTKIYDYAFDRCTALKSVSIPDSVEWIGYEVFYNCTALEEVTLGSGITVINYGVFYGCTALSKITFEGSAPTTIANNAFTDVTATAYYPSDDATWTTDVMQDYGGDLTWKSYVPVLASGICGGEGDGSNLRWVLTADGVLTISGTGEMANYSDSNPAPWSDRKASIVKVVMDDNATTVGGAAFQDCANLSQVKLPAALKLIRYDSFRGCTSLANITIPDTVTFIGSAAFRGCTALTQMELPAALTNLYGEAFYGCTALQSVTIPDTVTYFGQSVFCDCTSLKQVELPDGLTTVQDYLFDGCTSLESVVIPDTVRNIGNAVFRDCTSLKQIDLPAALLSIDYWTFSGCTALESIVIPDTVCNMGDSVFTGCTSLTQVQLSAKLETIEYYTFAGCTALESITIPASVTTIDEYAFYGCTALESIAIPADVTGIGEKAFLKCTALSEITFEGSAPAIADTAFTDVTATAYYPSDDATWTADVMQDYGGEITWVAQESEAEEPIYIYFADLTYDLSDVGDGQSWREYRNTYVDGEGIVYSFDAAAAAEVITAPGLYTIDAIDEDGVVTALSPVVLDLGTVEVVDDNSFMFTRGDGTTSIMDADDAVFVVVETDLEGEVAVSLGEISDLEAEEGFETTVAVVVAEEVTANLVYVFVTEVKDENLSFQSNALNLKAYIGAQFIVEESAKTAGGYDSLYIEVTHNGETSTVYGADPVGGLIGFEYRMYASQMTDKITVTLYGVKDGKTYTGETIENWSVRGKCIEMLDTYYPWYNYEANTAYKNTCDVVANMLGYGAQAQLTFSYNVEDLATDGVKAEYLALIKTGNLELEAWPAVDESGMQVKIYNRALQLKDNIEVLLLFAMGDDDMSAYHAEITYNGNTTTAPVTVYPNTTTYGYVTFNELYACDLREDISITIYKGDVAVSAAYTFSVENLAAGMQATRGELVNAIMYYSDAAKALFG